MLLVLLLALDFGSPHMSFLTAHELPVVGVGPVHPRGAVQRRRAGAGAPDVRAAPLILPKTFIFVCRECGRRSVLPPEAKPVCHGARMGITITPAPPDT